MTPLTPVFPMARIFSLSFLVTIEKHGVMRCHASSEEGPVMMGVLLQLGGKHGGDIIGRLLMRYFGLLLTELALGRQAQRQRKVLGVGGILKK
jgi:hypothetical protein